MKAVQVNRENNIARVETGIGLEDLYRILDKKGVALPGGTCPDVGVAGLTLGGGFGLLTRPLGLTCDNLLDVEMIVTSEETGAKVIRVNPKNHPDLFWASQGGGGGNFGIVTRFIFKVYPISRLGIFDISWDWDQFEEVFDFWQHWAPFIKDRRFTVNLDLNAKQAGNIEMYGEYIGPISHIKQILKPLLEIATPEKVKIREMSFFQAAEFFSEDDKHYLRRFKITGAYVYHPLPRKAIRIMKEFLSRAPNEQNRIFCQSFGGKVNQIAPEETAYYHRRAPFAFEYVSRWQEESGEREGVTWVEQLRNALLPYTVGDYVNFPDLLIKDWPEAYYGRNLRRLQEVKTEYDPLNVFHFPQSIPPLGLPDGYEGDLAKSRGV